MAPPSKVAIIGAGPQGLCALKNLLELNSASGPVFTATVFELRLRVGGVWSFCDNPDVLSTLKSTLANTSRWRNCYSDFPVSEAWEMDGRLGEPPVYLDQAESQLYFEKYVQRFDLGPFIQFGRKVVMVERSTAEPTWKVTTKDVRTGEEVSEVFDKVIVATGQCTTPHTPIVEGMEKFKGEVMHSCGFKKPEDFEHKRVLVVGFSNTAADTATELVGHARSIYISHRRGNYIFPRFFKHLPLDLAPTHRLLAIRDAITAIAPSWGLSFFDSFGGKISRDTFGARLKPEWRFFPAPSIVSSNPMVNDRLVPGLESGSIVSVYGIKRVVDGTTIELTDGEKIEVDAIVFATGYEGSGTLEALVKFSGPLELPRLYQNIFHPEYPDSLAFMSFWEVPTGICEAGDLIAMAISQVFAGRYSLPSRNEMEKCVDRYHKALEDTTPFGFDFRFPSSRQRSIVTNEASWRYFLHDAAGTAVNQYLGWGWTGLSWWFRERKLSGMVMGGVYSPHVYRLFPTREGGQKRWKGAKAAIVIANEEVEKLRLKGVKESEARGRK